MGTSPPWADLPQELLSTIANCLTSTTPSERKETWDNMDILSFRAVCKSWNSSSSTCFTPSPFNLSTNLPSTCMFPTSALHPRFANHDFGLPFVSVTVVFALNHAHTTPITQEQPNTWLLFADQLTSGKIIIRQPFSKCSYSMPLNFPTHLDVPHILVHEISRFYNFSFIPDLNEPPTIWSENVIKVVLFSDKSQVVALFDNGNIGSMFLQRSEYFLAGVWDHMLDDERQGPRGRRGYRIDDIVNYKGSILGVDHRDATVYKFCSSVWEPWDFLSTVAPIVDGGAGLKRKRLVESLGCLYLVVRQSVCGRTDAVKFKVYELDEDSEEWVQVDSIGDRIFFFGLEFSFSASTQELGYYFGKNCIIYKQGSFQNYNAGDEEEDDDTLFNDLASQGLLMGVWHLDDPCHIAAIKSYPSYSSVLWPPPAWLWSVDMSKRLEDVGAALGSPLMSIPNEKLKAMSEQISPVEQPMVSKDGPSQQDTSEIQRQAQILKECVKEATGIDKRLKRFKMNSLSRLQQSKSFNLVNQVGSSSCGTAERHKTFDLLHSDAISPESDDDCLSSEMALHASILHLEESISKLQDILKSHQQPCPSVHFGLSPRFVHLAFVDTKTLFAFLP